MNVKIGEFLKELSLFFPLEQRDEEKTKKILNSYAEIVMEETEKTKKKYDFRKLLRHIQKNYKYKTFPSVMVLLDYLPYGEVIEASFSGREGEVIKRVINGWEYEFTIVPNHWKNVLSIGELYK